MHTSNSYHFSLDNPPVGRTHNMSVPVSAYYVPMLPATATTTYAGLVWTPIGNLANIMLTVQLSGCSFLWRMHNGQLECCHYQPTAGIDGLALQQQLTGPGRNVYGREDYGEGRVVTIIGIRRGGQWRIYAQKFRVMTKEILSVHRLHPA